jgi:hypothetical protein
MMSGGTLVATAPAAQAWTTTPVSGQVVFGNVPIFDNGDAHGDRKGTCIHIYHVNGSEWANWCNGGGALSVTWVTWGWPNGSWRIRTENRHCHRKIFGSCVDTHWEDMSHFWVTLQNTAQVFVGGPDTAIWDDPQSVSAHVRDSYYGYALPGRPVYFTFGDQQALAYTDGGGNAYATMRAGGAPPSTTLTAWFPGDAYEAGASAAKTVAIQPIPSQVVLEGPFAVTYGRDTTFTARLEKSPPRSGLLPGRNLSLAYGSKSASGTTDANGRMSATWLLDMPPGSHTLSGSHTDDGQIGASTSAVVVETGKRPSTLQLEAPAPAHALEEITAGAWVRDATTGDGLPGRRVDLTLGPLSGGSTTDVAGRAEVTLQEASLDAGSYPIAASFPGSATQSGSNASGTIEILRRPTAVALSGPSSGRYDETATFSVTLTDVRHAVPISGEPIEFRLGAQVLTPSTDANGVATATLPLDSLPGSYVVSARYAGTSQLAEASATAPFELLKRPSLLSMTGHHEAPVSSGVTATTLSARVVDALTSAPIPGLPVTVTIGGQPTTSTTDADGRASFTPMLQLPRGLHDLDVSTPGSAYVTADEVSSLFGIGWEVFTDPTGAGLVAVDLAGARVRAIAPTNDPVIDTGVMDGSPMSIQGRALSIRQGGANGAVTGEFDLADATFEGTIDQGVSQVALARAFNTQPSAAAGADVEELLEGEYVALSGTVGDGDGAPFAWWDLDDGSSQLGSAITHRYDDDAVTDPVIYEPRVIAIDDAGAMAASTISVAVIDQDAPAAATITAPVAGAWHPDGTLTVTGLAEEGGTITVSDGGSPLATTTVPSAAAGTLQPWTTTVDLGHGDHQILAALTDRDGYPGDLSDPVLARIDLVAPNGALAFPVAGGLYDTTALALGCSSGAADVCGTTADDGSGVVSVEARLTRLDDGLDHDGDSYVASPAWRSATGVSPWTLTLAPDTLSDGEHRIRVRTTDLAGNVTISEPTTFELDRGAPAAPTILGPEDGAILSSTTVPIYGTAELGTTVTLFDGALEVAGPLSVDGGGLWSASIVLARGGHVLTARATDAAGNRSSASAARSIEVDDLLPAPAIVRDPAAGASVADDPVTLRGDVEPGALVRVTEGGAPLGATAADAVGAWSLQVALLEGSHTVRTTATDAAGNTSSLGAPHTFIVDRTAPARPSIGSPPDGTELGDASVVLEGHAEPDATISVVRAGTSLATAVSAGDGSWSASLLLAEGTHDLEVTARDAAGNPSAVLEHRLTIDLTPPPQTIIEAPDPGDVIGADEITLEGRTQPFATVNLYDAATAASSSARATAHSAAPIATTTADGGGFWAITVPLSEGGHAFTVEVIDLAGNRSLAAPIAFDIDRTPPDAPEITTPQGGERIAAVATTVRGTGEPGSRIAIQRGIILLGSATVAGNGRWFEQIALTPGATTIIATATDAAGNVSAPSAPRSFDVIGDTYPAVPIILSPLSGSTVRTRQVEIVGRTQPNANVEVIEDGVLATTTASSYGLFTATLTLASGAHEIAARADGGAAGPALRLTVEANDPVIASPTDGAIMTRSFGVSGLADAGRAVELLLDGVAVVATTSSGNGTFILNASAQPGPHTLAIRSGELTSVPVSIRIDGRAPTVALATPNGTVIQNPVEVAGTAEDDTVVTQVEVIYTNTVTNQVARRAIAVCAACGNGSQVSWRDQATIPAGAYRIEVRATDAVGNPSAKAYRQHVII